METAGYDCGCDSSVVTCSGPYCDALTTDMSPSDLPPCCFDSPSPLYLALASSLLLTHLMDAAAAQPRAPSQTCAPKRGLRAACT